MRRKFTALLVFLSLMVPTVPVIGEKPAGPVYLAVGDSYGFGAGTPRPDRLGYVPVLHRWLRAVDCRDDLASGCPHLELVNLSIAGSRSGSLITEQLPGALDLINERNSDGDPDNDVMYVTVTIGGNDLFNPVIAACSGGVTAECVTTITTLFATYQVNLSHILSSLRATAGPDTRILVSTYDNPLGSCSRAAIEPLADLVLEGGPGLPVGFNDLTRMVASATDTEVVDLFGLLGPGDWVGGEDCLHPDVTGYHEIAGAFLEVLS